MSTTSVPLSLGRASLARIGVLFILMGFAIATVLARIPAIRVDLGLGLDQLGLLLFGLAVGSMSGLLLAPVAMAAFGIRRSIVFGLTTSGAGLIVLGIGSSVLHEAIPVFIGLFLAGAGVGLIDVAMNVAGAAVERQLSRSLMPLLHSGYSLGAALGAALGTLLAWLGWGVIQHLLPMAAFIALGGLVAVLGLDRSIEHSIEAPASKDAGSTASRISRRERLRAFFAVWREPRILLICLVMMGFNFGEGSAGDWMATAVIDGHSGTEALGLAVYTVFMWCMFLGRLLGGPILDRFGRVLVLRSAAAVALFGVVAFIFAPYEWVLFLAAVCWGFGCSLGFPVTMSAAADDPAGAAQRVSAVATAGYFVILVGPPLLGGLGHAIGILNALFVVAGLLVIAFLAAGATRKHAGLMTPAGSAPTAP